MDSTEYVDIIDLLAGAIWDLKSTSLEVAKTEKCSLSWTGTKIDRTLLESQMWFFLSGLLTSTFLTISSGREFHKLIILYV